MWRKAIWLWAWLLAACLARADDPADPKSKPDKPATPADEYSAIEKEYATAQQEFSKLYREAKTNEDRQKLIQEKYPQPQKYADRMLELAKNHPDDPAAIDALTWVVRAVRGGKPAEDAFDALSRHLDSDKLAGACQMLGSMPLTPKNEQFLRGVLEKNPSHDVKANACLALAQALKKAAEQAKMANANDEAADKQSAEAEMLLDRVVNEFGDVKSFGGTLADTAASELFELRNLSIGKVAPDIAGEDLDGQAFKLSDYRGKVVMLDFWGNW